MAGHRNRHAAAFGECHRIGSEVEQHLADSGGIPAQRSGKRRVNLYLHGQPLVARAGPDHGSHRLDKGGRREIDGFELEAAGL